MTVEQRALALVDAGYFRLGDGEVWRCGIVSRSGSVLVRPPRRADISKAKGYRIVSVPGRHLGVACGRMLAHRLLWLVLVGPIPEDRELNHRNGVRDDNRIANLELVTHRENMQHAVVVLGFRPTVQCGEQHGRHRLSALDVEAIRQRCVDGESDSRIAASYPVTRQAIRHIRTGRNWRPA